MSEERADRILDAAAELLVAWGYRRVTIEDVARRAGIGKGTVYLHFKTKEMLFLTVLMREQARLTDRLLAAFAADPVNVLPSELVRLAYLWVHDDAIVHVIVTGDQETLGALVRGSERVGPLMKARGQAIAGYFEVLREHGVIRDDLRPEEQLHAFTAALTGFLNVDPYRMSAEEISRAAKADVLAYVVRSSLETPEAPARASRAVPQIIDLYRNLRELLVEEINRQKLT